MDHFLEELKDMKGWNKHTDKEDYKIYYRQEEGLKIISLFIEGIINAPLINIMALLAEVDLFNEWVPLCKESKLVGEFSHLRKLAYFKHNLPWPFTQREMYIQAAGMISKRDKSAVLVMSSAQGNEWMGKEIKWND